MFLKYSAIWKYSDEPKCQCLEEPSDSIKLFAIERKFEAKCEDQCDGQYCGTDDESNKSVAIYVNKYYQFIHNNCDQAFLQKDWPPYKDPIKFKSLERVSCKYRDIDFCQGGLLALEDVNGSTNLFAS